MRFPHFNRSAWLKVGLGALIIWISYGVYEAGNDNTPPPGNSPLTLMQGKGVGHRLSNKSWSLEYDRLKASDDSTFIQAEGIHNAVVYSDGKPAFHLSADAISLNLSTKDFEATGHVHVDTVLSGNLRTFDTAEARWREASQRLSMPQNIRLGGKGGNLSIAGATVDAHSGRAQLGRIDGTIQP